MFMSPRPPYFRFILSSTVTATIVVCCILMQILALKKLQLLGDFIPQTLYWGFAPRPCWGTSVSQNPSLLLCPPNNPVRSTPLVKCHERRLIPLAFFALSFENELQCHCLSVRVTSERDLAIWCKNLVNFCRVTPEIIELISQDILDGFSQYFHHMKALYVQMMDLYLIFQFVKGRCYSNQIILP